MAIPSKPVPARWFGLLAPSTMVLCGALLAQTPPAGPPTLGPGTPTGAQRGAAAELTLAGTNLGDPVAVGATVPNAVRFLPDGTLGKDSTKIRAALELPADAPLGFHRLWAAT